MFYGHYRSSTLTLTGCVKEFISTPHDRMDFPTSVVKDCDLCHKPHSFHFVFGHIASTPNQRLQIDRFCADRGLQQEVQIP